MAVEYIRLWKLLLDKGMKKTDLKTKLVLVQMYSQSLTKTSMYRWKRWKGCVLL